MEYTNTQIREARKLLGKIKRAISKAAWETRTAVDAAESGIVPQRFPELSRSLREVLPKMYELQEKIIDKALDELYQ